MNGTQNVNIDAKTLEECTKSTLHLGSVTYQNICDGSVHAVPWGTVDWIGVIILITIGISITALLLVGVIRIALDY